MSDTSQSPMVEIPWWQSQIIWKQIVVSICTILSGAGYVVSPDEQSQIVGYLLAIAGLTGTIWTIYDRIKKPCHPISSQVVPTASQIKGVPK